MAKGRKAPRRRARRPLAIGGLLVALVAGGALVAFAMRGGDEPPAAGERAYVPVSSFGDVHGLAVSPEDADLLYVATHHGLLRGVVGGEAAAWARVGSMQDDLMGFSMHPTDADVFWTSGHPRAGGNMGVRQSTDGGFTWRTTWDERVDFHAMTVSPADPARLWGAWAGQLYHSADGGAAWSVVNEEPPPMRALVAHPTDPWRLYATTQAGVSTSAEGGVTWTTLDAIPAIGLAVDPAEPATMYAGGRDQVWKSEDGGATWTPRALPGAGSVAFLAVSRSDPAIVYAASYETAVFRTGDGGAVWALLKEPER